MKQLKSAFQSPEGPDLVNRKLKQKVIRRKVQVLQDSWGCCVLRVFGHGKTLIFVI